MNISKVLFFASSDRGLEAGSSSRASFLFHAAFLKNFTICLFISFASIVANAQTDPDFKKTLHDRSVKIVNTLEITDSTKYNKVVEVVADQYFDLNKVHDKTKESITAIKALQLPDEEKNTRIKKEEEGKSVQLRKLHETFIAKLKKDLSEAQIEKIKDGMTYRVMPITYGAYLDMILTLTAEQKDKIYNWLKEARELAMDEGSSDDKHKMFGKYKGRINNYLSEQGYDMKKEEKAWQERIKEKEASKKNNAEK
jgi:hypothetical protein